MNEKEQLQQAQEQLRESIHTTFQELRNYGRAVASHTGAIYAEKKDDLISKLEFAKLEREMEREIKARTKAHKAGMKAALKEYEKEIRKNRRLQFKEGIKQKTSSVFGKLGQVTNDILAKLNPRNIDLKIRDFYEKMEIKALEAANKGKEMYTGATEKIDNFTTEQIAKYYEKQAEKQEIREQKEFEKMIKEQEKAMEAERKAETRERKAAMKEALREYDREQRIQRRLQFKEEMKQKANSVYSKMGQVKDDMLVKLNPSNIDVKLRNFYERAEIKALEAANKGKEMYTGAAEKMDNFTTNQIAKYYEKQAEKQVIQEQKEFEKMIKEQEKALEAERKVETKERKAAMKEALREHDKEERTQRRLQFKEEMKQKVTSVFGKLGQVKDDMIVQYYARKEEKQAQKKFKEAARLAEKEEIERIKARVRERKSDMKAALSADEREMYERKHLENEARKQELMESLYGEPSIEEETVAYVR